MRKGTGLGADIPVLSYLADNPIPSIATCLAQGARKPRDEAANVTGRRLVTPAGTFVFYSTFDLGG